MEFQELGEEKEGVFSFFPVYLMAEEGGVSVQRLLISQGFIWGAVEGATPGRAFFYRQGVQWAARVSLGSKVCVQGNVTGDACKCMPAVLSRHTSRGVCCIHLYT